MTPSSLNAWLARAIAAGALALLAACAQTPPAAPESPLERAATELARQLSAQLATSTRDATRRGLVLDPMLEAGGAQQTEATRALGTALAARLTKSDPGNLPTLPFERESLARAGYLLTGTFTRVQEGAQPTLRLDASLTELASSIVAAQASTRLGGEAIDATPLAYFRDSPVLVKDPVFDGYVRTAAMPAGQKADAHYLQRLRVAPMLERAQSLYGQDRFEEALTQYRSALELPEGDQMRTLNGTYLAHWRLGQNDAAEQAFARIVAKGIEYRQLGVKFLFKPGSTDFWPDPGVSGAYPMWLRQIAGQTSRAAVCMDVVGHTSRTGSAPYNDALSMQRAMRMQQLLAERAAELAARTKPGGMGFRQNLVGSGTDDALDALDRRVEFRITACP